MHDPSTLAHRIVWIVPKITKRKPSARDDARGWFQWTVRLRPFAKHNYISPFIYIGKYELYFSSFIEIWHTYPKGDAGPACHGRKHWKWHIHHMRIAPSFWYDFRQKHITRCAHCGKKSSKELGRVNHSYGVRGVSYHSACMTAHSNAIHEHDPRGCYRCSGKSSFEFKRKQAYKRRLHNYLFKRHDNA